MNKIITTGQGGMLLSNKKNMAKKAKYLSSQAKNDYLLTSTMKLVIITD